MNKHTITHYSRGKHQPMQYSCPVCGAKPGEQCTIGKCPNCGQSKCDCRPSEVAMAMSAPKAEAESLRRQSTADLQYLQAQDMPAWLEYQALSAIAHLRRLDPEHWLVKAVYAAQPAIRHGEAES